MATTTTYSFTSTRPEFIANSNGTGNFQSLSNVTALAGGGFALTYATENGVNDVPYVSIYNSATGAVSPLFLPYNGSGTNMQGEPVITRLSNGNLVVAWKEGGGGSNNIVATIFDPVTQTVVGAREIVVATAAGAADPEITALANGNWVMSFVDGTSLYVEVFNASGASVMGAPIHTVGVIDPAIVATADGGYSVVYTIAGNVRSEAYNSAGTYLGSTTHVSGGTNSAPQVAALKGGGFAIVYDDADFGGQPGIGLKLSTAAQDVVIRVDTHNPANGDRDPEITVLENGYIVVTWTHEFSGTDDDIYGHVFDANGTSISVAGNDLGGGVFSIDTSTLDQTQSSLAALLNGMFVTTWTNAEGDGNADGISGDVRELTRTITGDAGADIISGDELRDTIFGGGGSDILSGGLGNDSLHGDAGTDLLIVKAGDGADGAETLDGGADNDTLRLSLGAGGDFTFNLRNDAVTSIESIVVIGDSGNEFTAAVVLNASQFGAGVSATAQFIRFNDVGAALTVFMEGETSLDLSGLAFSSLYTVTINGDGDAETITGTTQDDIINGGGGSNILSGGVGNDTLTCGSGADQMFGGDGEDTFLSVGAGLNDESYGGENDDRFVLNGLNFSGDFDGGGGLGDVIDGSALNTSLTIDLGAGTYIDNLSGFMLLNTERAIGGQAADTITGSDEANILEGRGGADTLDGGGGVDVLIGGDGGDVYIIDSTTDTITELAAHSGIDEIRSSISFNFGVDNIELITLTGTGDTFVFGGDSAQRIVGNTGNNSLDGFGGADTLEGGGGADTLFGGNDDDIFDYRASADLAAGESIDGGAGTGDAIQLFNNSSYNLALAAISGVEQLLFSGGGGTASLLGTQIGAGQITSVFGDNGVNTLNVAGAAVNLSGVTFTDWTAGTDIININGTAGVDNLIGSGQRDIINGGGGADMLDGGLGADVMNGGAGDDTYRVGAGDTVSEAGGSGRDTVQTLLSSYTLGADIEDLSVTSGISFFGFGNSLGNVINGNFGVDGLFGGAGGDTLFGGIGNDALAAGAGDDTANGGANDDTLLMDDYANPASTIGNDIGNGDAGNDLLWGYGGNDQLFGGADNDSLVGNDFASNVAGNDQMFGGVGNDLVLRRPRRQRHHGRRRGCRHFLRRRARRHDARRPW